MWISSVCASIFNLDKSLTVFLKPEYKVYMRKHNNRTLLYAPKGLYAFTIDADNECFVLVQC